MPLKPKVFDNTCTGNVLHELWMRTLSLCRPILLEVTAAADAMNSFQGHDRPADLAESKYKLSDGFLVLLPGLLGHGKG